MEEIKYIEPAALHDEMLRLRNEKQMDFLESLTGMDWGVQTKVTHDVNPGTWSSLSSGIDRNRRTHRDKNIHK